MCLMIESMGDRRWLEVEARERVELDLEKVDLMLIADRENICIYFNAFKVITIPPAYSTC